MGMYVVYAKTEVPNLPKVIVVTEPEKEPDSNTGYAVTKKQGLRIPRDGGVQYPISKEDADLIKADKRLNSILNVKWLEHLDPSSPAKVVNAAVGKDLDAETKGKMAKREVESDAKTAKIK